MSENLTAQSEIVESLRAIQTAATERHRVLKAELTELEAYFPTLRVGRGRPKGSRTISPEERERRREWMKTNQATLQSARGVRPNGADAPVQ